MVIKESGCGTSKRYQSVSSTLTSTLVSTVLLLIGCALSRVALLMVTGVLASKLPPALKAVTVAA